MSFMFICQTDKWLRNKRLCSIFVNLFVLDDYDYFFVIIITARKQSLGQGNIFSSVCQEFCSRGGRTTWAGTHPGRCTPQVGTHLGQVHPHGQVHPPLGRYIPLGRYTPGTGTPPGQVHPLGQVHPSWAGTSPGRYNSCVTDKLSLWSTGSVIYCRMLWH